MEDRSFSTPVPSRRPPKRQIVGFVLTLGATALLVTALTGPGEDRPGMTADRASDAGVGQTPVGASSSVSESTATPLGIAASLPEGACLQEEALARVWLRAFLTRRDRNDDSWTLKVAPLSAPRLVDELRAAGPGAVGLEGLTSWRVERVDPVDVVDGSVDTPTRRVLAYAATVTDGTATVQKPFVLYSYLEADGCWRVEDVEQPYSSEG